DWSEVVSDTVNTGIYILEPEILGHIPAGQPCDFGHELFPALVSEGLPVFGYVTEDYWCDVGDVRAYLRVHADAMEGHIHLESLPAFNGRAIQRPGAVVDRAAVLEGPCLIEAGAHVHAGAFVGSYSVIGSECELGEGASVKRGILWPGAKLAQHAQVRGGVIAANACLGE
ncbi:MAG: sugar phosphate nucleotidyltransferase, partial [bacterium]